MSVSKSARLGKRECFIGVCCSPKFEPVRYAIPAV